MENSKTCVKAESPLSHSTKPHATACVGVGEPEVRSGALFRGAADGNRSLTRPWLGFRSELGKGILLNLQNDDG